MGGTVKNAVGCKDGSLALSFTDGTTLTVPFDEKYEAWEASADDGFMVLSLPGGRLAIWNRDRSGYLPTSTTQRGYFLLGSKGPSKTFENIKSTFTKDCTS
jgi:hypothetical protein